MSEELANDLTTSGPGSFCGVGVGPGMPGLIPMVAWQFVLEADVIVVPRSKSAKQSVARNCLPPHQIPEDRFREIEFAMESDRTLLAGHYLRLADEIGQGVRAGKKVAYLTIGDPLTYSTYIYILRALQERSPEIPCRTYPGITSYSALAAATGFALGEGRLDLGPDAQRRLQGRRNIRQHHLGVALHANRGAGIARRGEADRTARKTRRCVQLALAGGTRSIHLQRIVAHDRLPALCEPPVPFAESTLRSLLGSKH